MFYGFIILNMYFSSLLDVIEPLPKTDYSGQARDVVLPLTRLEKFWNIMLFYQRLVNSHENYSLEDFLEYACSHQEGNNYTVVRS